MGATGRAVADFVVPPGLWPIRLRGSSVRFWLLGLKKAELPSEVGSCSETISPTLDSLVMGGMWSELRLCKAYDSDI